MNKNFPCCAGLREGQEKIVAAASELKPPHLVLANPVFVSKAEALADWFEVGRVGK